MVRKALVSLPGSVVAWSADAPGRDISNHNRPRKDKKVRIRNEGTGGEGVGAGGEAPAPRPPSWHLKTNCYKPGKCPDLPDVRGFTDYLKFTADLSLDLTLWDMEKLERVVIRVPYTHRWHPKYRNATLARFYKFNAWWESAGKPALTLLTLTTYQDSAFSELHHGSRVDLKAGFRLLKTSWDKLRKMLRNRVICAPFDYIWTVEPHLKHETGYPHMHVAIAYTFSDDQKNRIKALWSDVYNAGSLEHGAQFEDSCLDAHGDIKNAGFYLFKYLGKGFCIDPAEMTPGELRFNAVLWEEGWRQWGASRSISRAMKLDYQDDGRYRFLEAGISMPGWETTFREASAEQKKAIRDELDSLYTGIGLTMPDRVSSRVS